jgi:hypothetical protein
VISSSWPCAGAATLAEEPVAASWCCEHGYDHECAINCTDYCTDYVWAPCMESGAPKWYCDEIGTACICDNCYL